MHDLHITDVSPRPDPNRGVLELFKQHCDDVGAAILDHDEFVATFPHFEPIINSIVEQNDDEEEADESFGGLAPEESSVTGKTLALAALADGTILACVDVRDSEGNAVAFIPMEETSIYLPPDSKAAMLLEFVPQKDAALPEESQTATHYGVRASHFLTPETRHAELSRLLAGDATGFYARKLQNTLDLRYLGTIDFTSLRTGTVCAGPAENYIVEFADQDGNLFVAELGDLPNGRSNGVVTMCRFPESGADFSRMKRKSPRGESLIRNFPAFFNPEHFTYEITEDDSVADDYLEDLRAGLVENVIKDWRPEWKLIASTAIFPKTPKNIFSLFVRIDDGSGGSLLPASGDESLLRDPLVSGMIVQVLETKTDQETKREFGVSGFVVSLNLVQQDLTTLCVRPSETLFASYVFDAVHGDLIERSILTAEEGDKLELGKIRVIYLTEKEGKDIYAVHVTHNFGEHVVYIMRNVPSGIVRTGFDTPEAAIMGADQKDIGTRYFFPADRPA